MFDCHADNNTIAEFEKGYSKTTQTNPSRRAAFAKKPTTHVKHHSKVLHGGSHKKTIGWILGLFVGVFLISFILSEAISIWNKSKDLFESGKEVQESNTVLNTDANNGYIGRTREWVKPFGITAHYNFAELIVSTHDGGFIVCGRTEPVLETAGNQAALIFKLDGLGNLIWGTSLGTDDPDVANSIAASPDGSFGVIGRTYSKNPSSRWPTPKRDWVIKLDRDGQTLWEKGLDSSYGSLNSIIAAPDSGYVVCGGAKLKGTDNLDAYVYKLNSDGVFLWEKTFGFSVENGLDSFQSDDYAESIIVTPDGGYLVSVYQNPVNFDEEAATHLLKLDTSGKKEWEKTVGMFVNKVLGMTLTIDKGVVLCGFYRVFNPDKPGTKRFAFVWKLNGIGEKLWEKKFECSDHLASSEATSIVATPDYGFLVCGDSCSGPWIFKLNSSGEVVWEETLAYSPKTIIATSDGGYALCGSGVYVSGLQSYCSVHKFSAGLGK
jgi:hypothetical protein